MLMGMMKKMLGRFAPRNSSRARLEIEMRQFASIVPNGSKLLDAGAGSHPYKRFFEHTAYESADFELFEDEKGKTTYVCDLSSIPVEGDRYDFVIFIQVMEHLPQPALVLKELFRVLKPGGKLLYTGPLFFEEHLQPYDFYRYTQFGLKYLFTSTGLRIERLDWLEGFFGTVAYQLGAVWRFLPLAPSAIAPGAIGYFLCPLFAIIRVCSAAFSVLFHWLEMKNKVTGKGYPKNYVATLIKPSSAQPA
jgi:SAM-dependent methyltransferase